MRGCHLVRIAAPVALIALALATGPAGAQTAAEEWTPPRLPDGRPDLQGVWLSNTATPLQRPEVFADRAYLTDEEAATLRARVERIFRNGRSAFTTPEGAFFAALNDVETYEAWSTSSSIGMVDVEVTDRTSLVVDPPDGRIPPLTPEARAREAAVDDGWRFKTGPEDLNNVHRCVTTGVPRLGGNFGAGPVHLLPARPDVRPRRVRQRGVPRCADHSARRAPPSPRRGPAVERRLARLLGTGTRWSWRPAIFPRTATTAAPPRGCIWSNGSRGAAPTPSPTR